MHDDMERIHKWQEYRRDYRKAADIMTELSQKRLSWYAVLLKFGEADIRGVHLTELTADDSGAITVQGIGNNFESVSNYMEALKKEKRLFNGSPQLEKSEMKNKGSINFVIKGKLYND